MYFQVSLQIYIAMQKLKTKKFPKPLYKFKPNENIVGGDEAKFVLDERKAAGMEMIKKARKAIANEKAKQPKSIADRPKRSKG